MGGLEKIRDKIEGMRRALPNLIIFLAGVIIGAALVFVESALNPPFIKGRDKPAPYIILEDDHFTRLTIGVNANISEQELCATLSQAADNHMFDGRDYMWYAYLFVDAFLIKDGKRSAYRAARLRRYVPIIDHRSQDSWELHTLVLGRKDRFSMGIQRARHGF